MRTVEEMVEIAVPVRTAYNQWTQFKSFPRFMRVVKRVEQIRPTITRWIIGFGPIRREFETEIVEQRPDSHMAWRSLEGRSRHWGEVSFRPTASGGSTVTVRIQAGPPGGSHFLANNTGLTRRVLRHELARFKEFIEGLGEEGGAWRGVIRDGRVQPAEPEPPRCRVPTWPVG
ncbi:SRPBCC family protein [Nonomuraea zeae]|uniref:SRPBCC family protein n=1 Tax=Nonomuraea zeae TaxID=1642303 RepID=A0A5S4FYZ3_9ACTN|nr:SRPBCC family protein [Nonomuraea zeae]TMR25919.1 SRPBCC family protein [Nonomuraea zeae]